MAHESYNVQDTPFGKLFSTRTDPDGNCFYHSYLQSVEDSTYSLYDKADRLKRVQVIRNYIHENLTPEDIFELVDSQSFENLKKFIDSYLISTKREPIEYHGSDFSIKGYVKEVENKYVGINKEDDFVKHVQRLIVAYGNQVSEYFAKDGSWMNDTFIPIFSKKLQVDIVFISSRTGGPIKLAVRQNFPAVIIMYHTGEHFESMGIDTGFEKIRVFTLESIEKLFGKF
jgi:DNA-binding transcriptional MerR regulator